MERTGEPWARGAPGEASVFANGKGGKLYASYQERLKVLNAADFGDLLLENIRLFREHPDVLRQYQHRFKYILVDEYQDTNVAQYLWLRLLSQTASSSLGALDTLLPPHPTPLPASGESEQATPTSSPQKNICCVGDDDQSIYGWRGAEVDNILRFDHGHRLVDLQNRLPAEELRRVFKRKTTKRPGAIRAVCVMCCL